MKNLLRDGRAGERISSVSGRKTHFIDGAIWILSLPCIKRMKKWIEDGAIGKLKFVRSSFAFQAEYDKDNRFFSASAWRGRII